MELDLQQQTQNPFRSNLADVEKYDPDKDMIHNARNKQKQEDLDEGVFEKVKQAHLDSYA